MRNVGLFIGLLVLAVILMAVGLYMDIKQESRMPSLTGFSKEAFFAGGTFSLILSGLFLVYGHIKECDERK